VKLLDGIHDHQDLKKLNINQLPELAGEIRELIIDVISKNGGHLASNLGIVELTLAMHYVFNSGIDKILFDVGHQSYTHKIITGRKDEFHTIRRDGGLSGFPRPEESSHDAFRAGHASTSISAALGFATARDLAGQNHKVIAVVGDGSLTGGLSYEGLNQAGGLGKNLLIILNDNEMSISKNVGALSKYLTDIITDQNYNKLKADIWNLTGKLPKKDVLRRGVTAMQEVVKSLLVPGQIFEKLGFRYFGPIDGHDLNLLVKTLSQVKDLRGPLLLHVITKKGKGYKFAEENPTDFHGIGSFDKQTGKSNKLKKSLPYTKVFGETLVKLAETDNKICAITAAMTTGTGLTNFSVKFPERFFDVGIAEQHGSTFAAGLAAAGLKPYFAVYSTFLQRGFDQLIHDVALQNLPVTFCIDRAGLVGEDGPTHHGCFDISYLLQIPRMTITAPKDGLELRQLMALSSQWQQGPFTIRYPRGDVPEADVNHSLELPEYGSWEKLRDGEDLAILAVGSMVYPSWQGADLLDKDGIQAALINCRFIKPIDETMLREILAKYKLIVTLEEGSLIGGFGHYIGGFARYWGINDHTIHHLGLPDKFIAHGKRSKLLKEIGLDSGSIASSILNFIEIQSDVSRKFE